VFKDVVLQLLGNFSEFFLRRKNPRKATGKELEKLIVISATSGDTGRCVMIFQLLQESLTSHSAAIYGL